MAPLYRVAWQSEVRLCLVLLAKIYLQATSNLSSASLCTRRQESLSIFRRASRIRGKLALRW
jgi:hypothetical protein